MNVLWRILGWLAGIPPLRSSNGRQFAQRAGKYEV
jgi:hypothetical protein